MDMDSSSTGIDPSSVDKHYTISTRVDELWSLVNGENSSYEKLDDIMESLANMLSRHKEKGEPPFWPIQQVEVEKLVETSVKLIGSSDNSRASCTHQILATRLLGSLASELLDREQTKLVYSVLIEALRAAIAIGEYSTLLIGSLSNCLSLLNCKHMITREEAADLVKQLIRVAGVAFNRETSNLGHQERYDLIWKMNFHEFYPNGNLLHISKNYTGLIICLYSLARYYGFDEYYEYAKSVFQYAELKGVLTSDVFVALNVLMIVYSSNRYGKFGYGFLDELAQITMGLMCISNDYIWGHLVSLLFERLYTITAHCNPVDRYDMSVLLIDHLLTKHDDPVADRLALRLLHTNLFMFGGINDALDGKEGALLNKLNQVETNEEFREEFSRHFRIDDQP